MQEILKNFESIGNNCEFGFFQAAHGIETGGLFRWAFVNDFAKLAEAIADRMAGSFQFDAFTPFSQTMIVDVATNIAYHTKMRIEDQPGLRFTDTDEERRAIHASEHEKFLYLRDKFFASLLHGGKIYVMKCNTGIPDSAVAAVTSALLAQGDATVFHVRRADAQNRAGTVIKNDAYLMTGFIDRFADYSQADNISTECWAELCANAWKIKNSDSTIEIGVGNYAANAAPITVPAGFDENEYYLANPGIKEAGMGAAEHYLNFGWKEGRPLRP